MKQNESNRTPEELLFDWHLDQLDEKERAWVESELLRNPEFRKKSDRLAKVLRPLDHWRVASPPEGLANRILRAVETDRHTSLRVASEAVTSVEPTYRPRPFLSFRDLIAAAACIALLAGVLIPALAGARARANETLCASNLGSIFQGTSLYQAAFDGSLPFAGNPQGAAWLPSAESGKPYASNSRHLFLLAKYNYGPNPGHFVCPSSSTDKPMDAADLEKYGDFALAQNVSYASLNLCGHKPNLRPRSAIAFASDPNPLFVGGRFNAGIDPMTANSPAHGGRGQRVLALDGSVAKTATPLFGANRDNVWLAGDIRTYTGTEEPTGANDAFLIQGYPTTRSMQYSRPLR